MEPDTIEIIVHGNRCPSWPNPQTSEEWLALQFVWVKKDNFTFGVCPSCEETVFVRSDGGMIDFGVEQPDLIKKNSVVIETFEPLVKP